jgi:RHS repeat-associated protein
VSPATTFFVHKDHLGSSRLLTKLDKSVQETLDFLPYGEQFNSTSTTTHKFTGKERDPESGLDNFGARYYGPTSGRFLSSDPGPLREEDPQSVNRFVYVRNNPLRYVDEEGEYWVESVRIAGQTAYLLVRETSKLNARIGRISWAKILDQAARREGRYKHSKPAGANHVSG